MQKDKDIDNGAPYAFISYSRDDYDTVEPIVHALKLHNYNVWLDMDMRPDGETPVMDEIEDCISNCAVFIAFHSETSAKSKWCKGEMHCAIHENKKILQVCIHDIEPPNLLTRPLLYILHENTEATLNWLEKAEPMLCCKCSNTREKGSEKDNHRKPVTSVVASQEQIAVTIWRTLDEYRLRQGRKYESLDELRIAIKSNDKQTVFSSERSNIASDVLYRRNGFDFSCNGIFFRHKSWTFPSEYFTSWTDFANPQNEIEPRQVDSASMKKFQKGAEIFRPICVIITIALCFFTLFAFLNITKTGPIFISQGLLLILVLLGYSICRENIKYKYIFVLLIKQTGEEKGICTCKDVELENYDKFLNQLRGQLSSMMVATEKSDGSTTPARHSSRF